MAEHTHRNTRRSFPDSCPACAYERQLEDAVLWLWHEMPTEDVLELGREAPALRDFLAHLHHAVEYEQAMVRRNVWADDPNGVWDEVEA